MKSQSKPTEDITVDVSREAAFRNSLQTEHFLSG